MQLGLGLELGTGNGHFIAFISLVLQSDKHVCLALMAWVQLSRFACERESVGVAREARDHSYFRTRTGCEQGAKNCQSTQLHIVDILY